MRIARGTILGFEQRRRRVSRKTRLAHAALRRSIPRAHEYPRQPQSLYPLSLRPAGHTLASSGAAAPGATLPHADRVLLTQGRAAEALHQLAAGSVRQLHRALRLSRA